MTRVRLRLLLLALLPLVVLLPILLSVTMLRWIDRYNELLIAKVSSDLRVAEQYFLQIEQDQAARVAAFAQSERFVSAQSGAPERLEALLRQERERLDLEFLVYGAPQDTAIFPNGVRPALAKAEIDAPFAGLALLSPSELDRLAPGLAERARLPILETAAARPIERDVEDRGMLLVAAHRTSEDGSVLLGGRLLNHDLDIIDAMNTLIYSGAEATDEREGTTTLFLDDVRISTNVQLFEGARALGTRVSEVVWRQVLQNGEPWLNRAFVVNDWYISGYLPLEDINGTRIGMLYTGFLEAPVTRQRNVTVLTLILAFMTVLALSVPIFLSVARGIFSPLERMSATMALVEGGDLDARIGNVSSKDEIGSVARHLDRLLDQIQERDEALRGYADNLNGLVEQRTQELREANQKLEATFAQLVIKEKLASLGEVTAGVAHEINNPVAVIQGNLELLRDGLSTDDQEALKTELDLIDAQTQRINIIVGKLLNFSKPGEMSDCPSLVDVKSAVDDALLLVAADLRSHQVETKIEHLPTQPVEIVESEFQQVLVNLMVNAAQAMPKGGVLTIRTAPQEQNGTPGTLVQISDTGTGIAADKIDYVFDPFFTTKRAEGTGLGLSISQALINRAGGQIRVESEFGVGATFFLWCPAADNLS